MRFWMRVVNTAAILPGRSAEVVCPALNDATDSRRRSLPIGSLANHTAKALTGRRRSAMAGCAWLAVSHRSLPGGQHRSHRVHRHAFSPAQPHRDKQ